LRKSRYDDEMSPTLLFFRAWYVSMVAHNPANSHWQLRLVGRFNESKYVEFEPYYLGRRCTSICFGCVQLMVIIDSIGL
jgi:hypothetical protein